MSTPTTVLPTTTVEETPFRRFVVQFRENKLAMAGLILMILLAIPAFAAPWIAPQNPYDIGALDILDSQMPPGSVAEVSGITYWLGTDSQARDVLSAVLYGMRTSLLVAFLSVTVSLLIGSTVGLCAAYFGGWLDALLMRIVDIQLSFPAILVALVMLSVLGQGLDKVIIALIIVQWAYFARTVRGTALVERNREYILAARCLSLGWRRIIARHLLPNCLPPLIVIATIDLANAIALEATLSFLGVGVPVTQPSLGMLIANGFEFMLSGQYWISFFPGIALALTIVGINLVGDHLRDILNPRNAL
ncbi:ABC transporter permease [Neorhizobium galegae]|uniref:ABC transporter permease n=1 Tax=Neorhizobium galegae TaxID=399 RepID=UPI0006214029|nr:ABC transporter permease [Neorhizobium galegae]CDZ28971.1 Dipeptide transport system permease protein (ABC superfamily, membrane) [Neorhizobium galegae bv. officinalis]KAA9383410.1 ABC transporter permease [Neorhizobium galegae]KAB1111574.1 ABC transporter permease [Neorhizobium galegae]MCM2500243.1 ABC transporter permease [Neorhizobium galegae]MCQ1770774.1 ABC transporter permease [Neorhizobium galegae]